MTKINIDNVEYDVEKLSDEVKAQLISIQFCDQELQRLKSQAAAIQTARQAYSKALQAALASEVIQSDKISFN
jgi:DNA repair ATPase RecN